MSNYIKEIKATLVFILIIGIFCCFLYLLTFPKVEFFFYGSVIGYILIAICAGTIKSISKNKILGRIADILLIPFWILYLLSYFVIPFGTLFMHLMFYAIITFFIPFTIGEILYKLNIFPLFTRSTILYSEITFSVFVSVLFNYQIRTLIYKFSPARIHTSKKLKAFQLDKLSDYLLSEKNIRFLIYSLYVITLIVINMNKFQNETIFNNPLSDNAVLQSFITFIAFDKVISLLKELEFKPSDFLIKIKESIQNKIREQKNNG